MGTSMPLTSLEGRKIGDEGVKGKEASTTAVHPRIVGKSEGIEESPQPVADDEVDGALGRGREPLGPSVERPENPGDQARRQKRYVIRSCQGKTP